MVELKSHKAYEMLSAQYKECLLDYIILQLEEPYQGVISHKRAVTYAFDRLFERERVGNYNRNTRKFCCLPEKMSAVADTPDSLLSLPDDVYYQTRPAGGHAFDIPVPIPYWYAFLEPPYGVPYVTKDFEKLNHVLFPFPDALEVYRFNDGFSDYFDEGKEWWGTGCWSAYDGVTGIFVIICASLSD